MAIIMKLIEALGLEDPTLITLIGGGGKTTTLFRLGEELVCKNQPIVITTTTSIFMPKPSTYDVSIITKDIYEAKEKVKENQDKKRILLGREIITGNKLKGFTPSEIDEIYIDNKDRWFLVEGDGSNGRSLKIPDTHEPQVPSLSSVTIILIGADILGKKINIDNVHRHHLINEIIQKCENIVDKKLILDLVFHPLGITKGIPNTSNRVILFNKIRSSGKLEEIYDLSEEIMTNIKVHKFTAKECKDAYSRIDAILLGEVRNEDPILKSHSFCE